MSLSHLFRRVLFLSLAVYLPAISAAPAIDDHWKVIEDKSDDPHDRLKGLAMLRQSNVLVETPRAGQPPTRQTQLYNEIELNKRRHLQDTEADVGGLSSVLFSDSIQITPTVEGFDFTYEDGFKRTVNPRVGGPVYSAKGDEFTQDQLGRSMIYWRGGVLVIETMLAPRGNMTEEIALEQPLRKLKVHTKISNPDWLLDADIERRFAPAGEGKE